MTDLAARCGWERAGLEPSAQQEEQQEEDQQEEEELADEDPAAEGEDQDDHEEQDEHWRVLSEGVSGGIPFVAGNEPRGLQRPIVDWVIAVNWQMSASVRKTRPSEISLKRRSSRPLAANANITSAPIMKMNARTSTC
jgi:hypothetical protein